MTKLLAALLGCASLLLAADLALAKDPSPGEAPSAAHKAHKHTHLNGHDLLGENLKHDGKHAVGKLGANSVSAEVKGGKVVNMSAGNLPVKHVKSNTKMAQSATGLTRIAFNAQVLRAQYDQAYYAYCFDDGYNYTCYWYPASDVDPSAYTWDPYDPAY
jgi:hypothetical protein